MTNKQGTECGVRCGVQTHADYEQRLQEEVNARLLKEQELQHLVHFPFFVCHALASS